MLVEKVSLPPDVKKGETVNINVVIRASEPTRGTLQIFQKADNYRSPAAGNEKPMPVELERGINVFTLKQTDHRAQLLHLHRRVRPRPDSGDRRAINNVAEGFTHARGDGPGPADRGDARASTPSWSSALREKGIEVTTLVAPRIDGAGVDRRRRRCRPTWPSSSPTTP